MTKHALILLPLLLCTSCSTERDRTPYDWCKDFTTRANYDGMTNFEVKGGVSTDKFCSKYTYEIYIKSIESGPVKKDATWSVVFIGEGNLIDKCSFNKIYSITGELQ